MGLAVLSLVTASVAAMLVEVEERAVDSELLREIHSLRLEVRHLRERCRPGKLRPNKKKPATRDACRLGSVCSACALHAQGDQTTVMVTSMLPRVALE